MSGLPKLLRSVRPLRGLKNPFSSRYRKTLEEGLEFAYDYAHNRDSIKRVVSERQLPWDSPQGVPVDVTPQTVLGELASAANIPGNPHIWMYEARLGQIVLNGQALAPTFQFLVDEEGELLEPVPCWNLTELNNIAGSPSTAGYGLQLGPGAFADISIREIQNGQTPPAGGSGVLTTLTKVVGIGVDGSPADPVYVFNAMNIAVINCINNPP